MDVTGGIQCQGRQPIQISINNTQFMLLLPLHLRHACFFCREHNGKVSFRSAPVVRPPTLFLFPVGDFRNGLETPPNFHLNRVIISERRSPSLARTRAAQRRRPNGIENIHVAVPRWNFSQLQAVSSTLK